jgi:HEAT repeat protein
MKLAGIAVLLVVGVASAQAPKKGAPKKADISADVAALVGADPEVAQKAAEKLGESALPAAHDALLDALAMGLDPFVAPAAIAALTSHPAPADVVALRRYAGHRHPNVRGSALLALALYPDPAARATVVAALRDKTASVRSAAAQAAAKGRVRDAVDPMLQLLAKGEEPSAKALAQLADPDLARRIADHYGKVPDPALALALGTILKRADFGPDAARVEIVRALAKIQDASALRQLEDYIAQTPKNPPRPSRQEAEMVIDARGGK